MLSRWRQASIPKRGNAAAHWVSLFPVGHAEAQSSFPGSAWTPDNIHGGLAHRRAPWTTPSPATSYLGLTSRHPPRSVTRSPWSESTSPTRRLPNSFTGVTQNWVSPTETVGHDSEFKEITCHQARGRPSAGRVVCGGSALDGWESPSSSTPALEERCNTRYRHVGRRWKLAGTGNRGAD